MFFVAIVIVSDSVDITTGQHKLIVFSVYYGGALFILFDVFPSLAPDTCQYPDSEGATFYSGTVNFTSAGPCIPWATLLLLLILLMHL